MSRDDGQEPDDHITIVVDGYKVVLRVPPGDLGEKTPRTWSDVLFQVNGHLMRIATGATRLVAEALENATRLVRGIATLPAAVTKRLTRAHDEAERVEIMAQQESLVSLTPPAADDAVRTIDALLSKYKVRGDIAEVRTDGTRIVVVIVRSEAQESLEAVLDRKSPGA